MNCARCTALRSVCCTRFRLEDLAVSWTKEFVIHGVGREMRTTCSTRLDSSNDEAKKMEAELDVAVAEGAPVAQEISDSSGSYSSKSVSLGPWSMGSRAGPVIVAASSAAAGQHHLRAHSTSSAATDYGRTVTESGERHQTAVAQSSCSYLDNGPPSAQKMAASRHKRAAVASEKRNKEKKRELFIPFLIRRLDNLVFAGCEWVDRQERIFKLPWLHRNNGSYQFETHAALFKAWASNTGKLEKRRTDVTTWKINFRSVLNAMRNSGTLVELNSDLSVKPREEIGEKEKLGTNEEARYFQISEEEFSKAEKIIAEQTPVSWQATPSPQDDPGEMDFNEEAESDDHVPALPALVPAHSIKQGRWDYTRRVLACTKNYVPA